MALKFTWINPDRIMLKAGAPTAQRVDVRLRCLLPAKALAARGHRIEAYAMPDLLSWQQNPAVYGADVYIIGKTVCDLSPVVHRIRQGGARVILDLCDNVFEPPEDNPKPHTQAILPFVHGVVTSTQMLQATVTPHLPKGIPVVAIPDCVEGSAQPPHFDPSPRLLKLLWYGYENNLPHVQRLLPQLTDLPAQAELTLVTAWNPGLRERMAKNPQGIATRLVEWSIENMAAELARTDMVIVPSSQEPAYRTRSPNRIITAIQAGRYVAAYPLPSYMPFALFAGIGENLLAEIMSALRDPDGVRSRIANGQAYIAREFSNEVVAQKWESFASQIR
jgi:hypothetical protein